MEEEQKSAKDYLNQLGKKIIVIGPRSNDAACLIGRDTEIDFKGIINDYELEEYEYHFKQGENETTVPVFQMKGLKTVKNSFLLRDMNFKSSLCILVYIAGMMGELEKMYEKYYKGIKKINKNCQFILVGIRLEMDENARTIEMKNMKNYVSISNFKKVFVIPTENPKNVDNILYEAAEILLDEDFEKNAGGDCGCLLI